MATRYRRLGALTWATARARREKVAIKVVRKIERYVEDAEIEVDILDRLRKLDKPGKCVIPQEILSKILPKILQKILQKIPPEILPQLIPKILPRLLPKTPPEIPANFARASKVDQIEMPPRLPRQLHASCASPALAPGLCRDHFNCPARDAGQVLWYG